MAGCWIRSQEREESTGYFKSRDPPLVGVWTIEEWGLRARTPSLPWGRVLTWNGEHGSGGVLSFGLTVGL